MTKRICRRALNPLAAGTHEPTNAVVPCRPHVAFWLFQIAAVLLAMFFWDARSVRAETVILSGSMHAETQMELKQTFDTTPGTTRLRLTVPKVLSTMSRSTTQEVRQYETTYSVPPTTKEWKRDDSGNEVEDFIWEHPAGTVVVTSRFVSRNNIRLRTWESAAPYPVENVPQIVRRYLEATPYVQKDEPAIVEKARALVQGVRTQREAVGRILNYVADRLTYKLEPERYDASWALQTGQANCTGYSHVSMALLRAAGIPARGVIGLTIGKPWPVTTKTGNLIMNSGRGPHAWFEVWFPDLGWLPFDAQSTHLFVPAYHIRQLVGRDLFETNKWFSYVGAMPKVDVEFSSNLVDEGLALQASETYPDPRRYILAGDVRLVLAAHDTAAAPRPTPVQAPAPPPKPAEPAPALPSSPKPSEGKPASVPPVEPPSAIPPVAAISPQPDLTPATPPQPPVAEPPVVPLPEPGPPISSLGADPSAAPSPVGQPRPDAPPVTLPAIPPPVAPVPPPPGPRSEAPVPPTAPPPPSTAEPPSSLPTAPEPPSELPPVETAPTSPPIDPGAGASPAAQRAPEKTESETPAGSPPDAVVPASPEPVPEPIAPPPPPILAEPPAPSPAAPLPPSDLPPRETMASSPSPAKPDTADLPPVVAQLPPAPVAPPSVTNPDVESSPSPPVQPPSDLPPGPSPQSRPETAESPVGTPAPLPTPAVLPVPESTDQPLTVPTPATPPATVPPTPPPPVLASPALLPSRTELTEPFECGNLEFPAALKIFAPISAALPGRPNEVRWALVAETAEYATGPTEFAQAFRVNRPMALEDVSLAMQKFGGTAGELWLELRTDSGGNPGPIVLDESRRLATPHLLPFRGYRWIVFDFNRGTGGPVIAPGRYWLILRHTGDAIFNWYFTPGTAYGDPDDSRARPHGQTGWNDILTYRFNFRVSGLVKP